MQERLRHLKKLELRGCDFYPKGSIACLGGLTSLIEVLVM